jgi:hypothetical protein
MGDAVAGCNVDLEHSRTQNVTLVSAAAANCQKDSFAYVFILLRAVRLLTVLL